MPVYGSQKNVQIARSVLPARRNAARMASEARAQIHRADRHAVHRELHTAPTDDCFDATVDLRRCTTSDIRQMMYLRRGSDNLGALLRWAEAKAGEFGDTPEERVARLRAELPKGLIGEHAISHVRYLDSYRDPRFKRRWYTPSYPVDDRAVQSLTDRLACAIRCQLDLQGELNAVIKSQSKRPDGTLAWQPRLLAGAHDVDDFVAEVVARQHRVWRTTCECAFPHRTDPDRLAGITLHLFGVPLRRP